MQSDQDLERFSEHVLYEMAMLVGIPKRFDATKDVVIKNALLESFAIHARQLVNFFYDHAEQGEIVASSYFDDPLAGWKKIRGKEDSNLKELVTRVGEEIAHLTLARIQHKRDWNMINIVADITSRCDQFLQGVQPSRLNSLERNRFLKMLQDHNNWIGAVQYSQPAGPARPVEQPNGASTSACSGFMGINLTGKTCPLTIAERARDSLTVSVR